VLHRAIKESSKEWEEGAQQGNAHVVSAQAVANEGAVVVQIQHTTLAFMLIVRRPVIVLLYVLESKLTLTSHKQTLRCIYVYTCELNMR
jgi:hypothetical protein